MIAAAMAEADEPPPVPPPDGDSGPDDAAAEDGTPQPKRQRKPRAAVTDSQRALVALREERTKQRRVLAELRQRTKHERRNLTNLNRKAGRVNLHELLQISLLKFQQMQARGEIVTPDDGATAGAASSSAAPCLSGAQAVAAMEIHLAASPKASLKGKAKAKAKAAAP